MKVERTTEDELDFVRGQRDLLSMALARIIEHVGAGCPDIIVANTVLGRINQEAKQALKALGES